MMTELITVVSALGYVALGLVSLLVIVAVGCLLSALIAAILDGVFK